MTNKILIQMPDINLLWVDNLWEILQGFNIVSRIYAEGSIPSVDPFNILFLEALSMQVLDTVGMKPLSSPKLCPRLQATMFSI